MRFNDEVRVLDALDAKGVDYWVGGGWGIAILVGSQTRAHRDLDLAIKTEDLDDCLESLKGLGYATETDWLPVRVELMASGAQGQGHPRPGTTRPGCPPDSRDGQVNARLGLSALANQNWRRPALGRGQADPS